MADSLASPRIWETTLRQLLVIRSELLPLSETFIKQQIVGLRSWQATLVGRKCVENGLDISGLRTQLLRDVRGAFTQRVQWGIFQALGWPQPRRLQALLATCSRAELAHVHFGTDAVVAWRWLRWLNLPIVVTLHGFDVQTHPHWWAAGGGGRGLRAYPQWLYALGQQRRVSFIAVSEAVRRSAIDVYGLPAEKIHTLHIGVDTQAFLPGELPIGERKPTVLFVGRLVEKKGLDVLIRAMQIVRQRIPDASATVVGDGPLRAEYERLIGELKAPVHLLGPQPNLRVREALASAYVFCLPSVVGRNGDAEGLPISILEAQASGVPVITSAVGGRDEGIIDGITGYAFAEHDHLALAERLCELMQDRELATRMGIAARRFAVERFDLADCTRALEVHYAKLVAGTQS